MNKDAARKNVEDFIFQRKYTYTVQDLIDIYLDYYKKGYYISYTMKDCVEHLKDELELLSAKLD